MTGAFIASSRFFESAKPSLTDKLPLSSRIFVVPIGSYPFVRNQEEVESSGWERQGVGLNDANYLDGMTTDAWNEED